MATETIMYSYFDDEEIEYLEPEEVNAMLTSMYIKQEKVPYPIERTVGVRKIHGKMREQVFIHVPNRRKVLPRAAQKHN